MPYLQSGHTSAPGYRDVCIVSSTGDKYGFNKLLLASVSALFRDLLLEHFSNLNNSSEDKVCFSTNFTSTSIVRCGHHSKISLHLKIKSISCFSFVTQWGKGIPSEGILAETRVQAFLMNQQNPKEKTQTTTSKKLRAQASQAPRNRHFSSFFRHLTEKTLKIPKN